METKEGTKNLLTQPLCDNVQEEEVSGSKKNDDIPAELRNDLDKLQIESDDTALKANMTTDESNIRSQTKEDTHKRTTASPTSLRQETNKKKARKMTKYKSQK